jgi:K+-sensing histidine kinase KdpD
MTLSHLEVGIARSRVLQYGLALSTTAVAFALALLAHDYNFPNVEIPLFLFVIAVTAWYAGSGPAALAAALSILAVDYYFTEPRYSFAVRFSDAPYFVLFVCCALLVAWFSTIRRRVEQELLQNSRQTRIRSGGA